MVSLFESGVRPAIDKYLSDVMKEKRDYGEYWSASSAGYCHRKLMFERLGLPPVSEDSRKYRVFESGKIFHEWVQRITKDAGISIAQELELQDEELMIRGHIDDLLLIDGKLQLVDYKTQNSRAFSYQKDRKKDNSVQSHFHRMQLGTYMYMLRSKKVRKDDLPDDMGMLLSNLDEARVVKISKDDLRMSEEQLFWTPALEKEVVGYWTTLNGYWESKKFPACTCANYEGGFMSKEAYNPYFFDGEPCSLKYLMKMKESGLWQPEK